MCNLFKSPFRSDSILKEEEERCRQGEEKMDDVEIKNFIKVWILALASLCYSYYICARIPRGLPRLLSILPVLYIFTFLPFTLTSSSLGGGTAFLLLWLGNFKILLFSFDQGPLSPPHLKLSHFIPLACLPIEVKKNPSPKSTLKPSQERSMPNSVLLSAKILFLVYFCYMYRYRHGLPKSVVVIIYCSFIYVQVDLLLSIFTALVSTILGIELEPQFDQPYLATSLQDFWGRRWNLSVTRILRPSVYNPTRRVIGPQWSSLPAVVAVFAVSGLMHELIFYQLTRERPTWEVTWFFVLHGICVAIEVVVKKAVRGRWKPRAAVSRPVIAVFVAVTGYWLFFPQFVRCGIDEKLVGEYLMFVDFVKGIANAATMYLASMS